jgi:hypothetical protein
MGQYLSVTLLGEGPACIRLARDLGCKADRVGESPDGAVPVCNPFGGGAGLHQTSPCEAERVGCCFWSLHCWCVSAWHACGCGLLDYTACVYVRARGGLVCVAVTVSAA